VYIFCGSGLASCRWRQLTSIVRPHVISPLKTAAQSRAGEHRAVPFKARERVSGRYQGKVSRYAANRSRLAPAVVHVAVSRSSVRDAARVKALRANSGSAAQGQQRGSKYLSAARQTARPWLLLTVSAARATSRHAKRSRLQFGAMLVSAMWPNPSFKRTRNGVPLCPRSAVGYPAHRGHSVTPLRAA
jgi:hypothetical protein